MNKSLRTKFPLSSKVKKARIKILLTGVNRVPGALPLSTEDTLNLIEQHRRCKGAGQLPFLIVAAAYNVAKTELDGVMLKLADRNGARGRASALREIQIRLVGDVKTVILCELKHKAVQRGDIDRALQKIAAQGKSVQNYIFISTETVAEDVREYARSKYDETGGVEIAILDCIGFLRHFLHLFHRLRKDFLDQYQVIVLREPDSAVSQALKEAFLALRQAAESAE
jgi:hypothetical protein